MPAPLGLADLVMACISPREDHPGRRTGRPIEVIKRGTLFPNPPHCTGLRLWKKEHVERAPTLCKAALKAAAKRKRQLRSKRKQAA